MDRAAADRLAAAVLRAVPDGQVAVRADDPHWVVEVATVSAGVFTLYDEADWQWLRPQVTEVGEP